MKKISLLIVFACLLNTFVTSQTHSISKDYSNTVASPLMFINGDTLLVNCDTIYAINPLRYQFYKSMHLSLRNDADTACMHLLTTYEKRLLESEQAYDLLLINSKSYQELTESSIDETKSQLIKTQGRLQFAQENLGKATEDLKVAQGIIKKEQWKSRGRNLLFGLGGIGIGLITGILITK